MTSGQLIRWQARHAKRAGAPWTSGGAIAVAAGIGLSQWVAHAGGTIETASHAWLAGTLLVFVVAFLRVPFHIYWRADAVMLAQLPIGGLALFDAAAWRCARAAGWGLLAALVGAYPFAGEGELFLRHAAVAGAFAAAAAGLVPAIATWGATLVARSASGGTPSASLRLAGALATASPTGAARAATSDQAPAPSALLGALPGFGATVVIVLALLETKWLTGGVPAASPGLVLGGLGAGSVVAWLGARALAPAHMGTILRDVSALDRQQLAMLEIHPPTALERGIASRLGAAALPYRKDARLVRRRYPMAFALGALAFVVLVAVGAARPADPAPWLIAVLGGTALYAVVLAVRLRHPPLELPRLSATLPIAPSAIARAKLAWLAAWWLIFVGAPAAFALARVLPG